MRRSFNLASTRKALQQTPGTSAGKSQDTSSSSPGTLAGGTSRDPLPGTGPPRLPVNQLVSIIIIYCKSNFDFYEPEVIDLI